MYDYRHLYERVTIIVLMRQVVTSSQYDFLVFVAIVRHLFVLERFERTKYIRSKTKNQINDRQYATEPESKVL